VTLHSETVNGINNVDDDLPELIIDEEELVTESVADHNQGLLATDVLVDSNSYDEKVRRIRDNPVYMERIDKMIELALHVFPLEKLSADFIVEQVFKAVIEKDRDMSLDDCIEYGGDFVLPADEIERNSALFRACNHDFPEFIRRIQEIHLKDRFNEQRVLDWMSPTAVDFDIMLEMSKGIKIITADGWVPNYHLGNPKLRRKYILAHHGLNKIISKQSSKNTIVILPMSDRAYLPPDKTHESVFSHANKPGNPGGRIINEFSNLGPGEGQPLNNENMKAKIIAKYGGIEYPTLLDIVRMIIRMAIKYGWRFIILWKDDLVGAYTLLNIHPESVSLLCAELINNPDERLLAFNTAMAFGGVQFPYVMNVVSRNLQLEYNVVCTDGALIYSDDSMGCCYVENLSHDVAAARKAQTDLLGPGCIDVNPETTKYKADRILSVIGWEINLDTRLVSMSVRNSNKCLYAFFMVDTSGKVIVKEMEKLASLASRYCQICKFMQFTTQDLHRMAAVANRETRHALKFSGGAKFAISLWRVILILMNFNPNTYTCHLESFIFELPRYIIGHDGCLYGIGFIIWEVYPNGERYLLKFCGASILSYGLGVDSGFQNTSEFISMTMGLATLVQLGITDTPVFIESDSTASISWAEKGNHRSCSCQRATALFTMLGFFSKNYVSGAKHVAGISNTDCDALSRLNDGIALPDICKENPDKRIFIERDNFLNKLLNWSNPKAKSLFNKDGTMTDIQDFNSINLDIKSYCNK